VDNWTRSTMLGDSPGPVGAREPTHVIILNKIKRKNQITHAVLVKNRDKTHSFLVQMAANGRTVRAYSTTQSFISVLKPHRLRQCMDAPT
jgi:hypothetical protein